MYILIPLILSVICLFVNPYVGLFGIFTVVELIIILCVDINANARIKLCYKVSGENAARGTVKEIRKGSRNIRMCPRRLFYNNNRGSRERGVDACKRETYR